MAINNLASHCSGESYGDYNGLAGMGYCSYPSDPAAKREGLWNRRPASLAEHEALPNAVFSQRDIRTSKGGSSGFLSGNNICLSAGTASGKSLVFYAAAIERLIEATSSTIVAIYPLRALAREQEDRWRKALGNAGVSGEVGRIDGQAPTPERPSILRKSRGVVLTPDIIHAWLLSSLSETSVRGFLQRVSLVIVDEVHSYTGVFGSNAAFLFRRMQHAMRLVGASPKYICASATISEARKHLQKLFGLDFVLIGPEQDTSPRYELEIQLVQPPGAADLLTEVSTLLEGPANQTSAQFIVFVDSRKQTELITSILARSQGTNWRPRPSHKGCRFRFLVPTCESGCPQIQCF